MYPTGVPESRGSYPALPRWQGPELSTCPRETTLDDRVTGRGHRFEFVEGARRMNAMNRRGKIFALSTAAVGVLVLLAAGIAGKDRIREEWWIHRLQAGNAEEQVYAVMRLEELRSVRAIPHLFRVFGEVTRRWSAPPDVEPEEDAVWHPLHERRTSLGSENSPWDLWNACILALHEIAVEAPPGVEQALLQALCNDAVVVRAYSCDLLGSMRLPPKGVVSALQRALHDEDRSVRRAAGHALKKIQVY